MSGIFFYLETIVEKGSRGAIDGVELELWQ